MKNFIRPLTNKIMIALGDANEVPSFKCMIYLYFIFVSLTVLSAFLGHFALLEEHYPRGAIISVLLMINVFLVIICVDAKKRFDQMYKELDLKNPLEHTEDQSNKNHVEITLTVSAKTTTSKNGES